MKFFKLHWFIIPLFIAGCARQTSPTGGPKDTIPPTLITRSSIPLKDQTNFKGRELELKFSEMVIINNPKEEIIITPSIGKDYDIKTKKDKVIISLDKDLQDSTTYTFNFRESIQDITEKNPAKNLQLSFSTGPFLDSLSIQGYVFDVLSSKPLEDMTVAIKPEIDTFNIFKHPATYFTKSDKNGNFAITHLKPGVYHIYAIDDKNKNLIADTKSEMYGFLKDSLLLNSNNSKTNIGLVHLDARPLKMTSARPSGTYFNIRFIKGLQQYTLSAADSSDLYSTFSSDHANILLYNTLQSADSLQVHLMATDSIQNTIDTTLYMKFTTRETAPERFNSAVTSSSLLADKGRLKATLQFSKPVKEINFDSISFQIDSLNTIRFNQQDIEYEEPTRTLTLHKQIDQQLLSLPKTDRNSVREKEPKQAEKKFINEIRFGRGSFFSIENDTSALLKQTITPQRTEDLGIIIANVSTTQPHYILQLINKNDEIVMQQRDKAKVTFNDLLPGDYEMRIIVDSNNNGRWDPGNYMQRVEPEIIKYYKNEKANTVISLKANWEIGPLLITY
jgi:uncharacterized protein (DUF2141 family)